MSLFISTIDWISFFKCKLSIKKKKGILLCFVFGWIFKLENELEAADKEYRSQLEQCIEVDEEMATILSPPRDK